MKRHKSPFCTIYIIIGSLLLFSASNAEAKKVAVEDTLEYPMVLSRSYLKMIENSRGSRIYRNLYFRIKGKTSDALENGNLSCAYYVASVLKHFDLIKEFRTLVDELVIEMKKHGWQSVKEPKPGSVIVWEKVYFPASGEWHGHIGFYVGKGWVISNSSKRGYPVRHYWRREPVSGRWRKVVEILWHPKLED
ncbi:hypothetical protein KJ885_05555 [Patescibacteria group bacterium]|nr:hypothetical protein [Patescibacteria group bacterium]